MSVHACNLKKEGGTAKELREENQGRKSRKSGHCRNKGDGSEERETTSNLNVG